MDHYIKSNCIATLKDNAIRLVDEGITSLEEVYP